MKILGVLRLALASQGSTRAALRTTKLHSIAEPTI
jgi:hypothetical protein